MEIPRSINEYHPTNCSPNAGGVSCTAIRRTTSDVLQDAQFVSINSSKLKDFAQVLVMKISESEKSKENNLQDKDIEDDCKNNSVSYIEWDECGWHFCDDRVDKGGNGVLTTQYIFVLDALNWCFWPTKDFEYEQLAMSLTNVLRKDNHAFDAMRLLNLKLEELQSWFSPNILPTPAERLNKIHELGYVLHTQFDGQAINLVKRANHSATKLVDLVVQHFPGFRDHSIYNGKQVFFTSALKYWSVTCGLLLAGRPTSLIVATTWEHRLLRRAIIVTFQIFRSLQCLQIIGFHSCSEKKDYSSMQRN